MQLNLYEAQKKQSVISLSIIITALKIILLNPFKSLKAFAYIFKSRKLLIAMQNLAVFFKALWVADIALKWKADHIYAQWAATTTTMALVASEITGVPFSFTAHRWDLVANNLLALKIEKSVLARFISKQGLELSASLCAGAKKNMEVHHVGVYLPEITNPIVPPDKNKPFVMICPANLFPVKGHKYLIEAISLVIKAGYNVRLIIAGDGYLMEELQQLSNKLDLSNIITYNGLISHDHLMGLYRNRKIDCTVLASVDLGDGLHEGIPVSLIEAMSWGIPVISTKTGGIPELLAGNAGLMVPDKDSQSLSSAIINLINDSNLYISTAKIGLERIKAEYDVEIITAAIMQRMVSGKSEENTTFNKVTNG